MIFEILVIEARKNGLLMNLESDKKIETAENLVFAKDHKEPCSLRSLKMGIMEIHASQSN